MKRHGVLTAFPHSHLGEEKQEMLCLNRRLENYLNRVKLLEEENALLAKEIRSLRHNDQRALTRRKGLEEELQQARLEVDAAWRDRVHTELEVGRLTDELHALNLHRQREAQAHMKAQTMLERSRKVLEEEHRAQIWLREKSSQLELELRLLIQSHQEDVAHLEATLTRSRSTAMPTLAQRGSQTPTLLQLGQEFSQKATRAWQEAAEAYQSQLAQLEESLNQARSRLSQVNQEKSESHMKLQSLQKEVSSAQDIRLHLEKTAAQQGARHGQEIQELQEHLEELEVEKEELGQQINHILLQNQGLLQLKMSLGLEVATYRALLDSDVSTLSQPRTFSNPDAVLCSRTSHRVASRPSVNGVTVITANPVSMSKPRSLAETPKVSKKTADATQSPLLEATYPKIVADGAVENFRPQEVCETVTHAEPLSPPDEPQPLTTSADKEDEEDGTGAEAEAPQSFVHSYQVECGFSSEPRLFTASEPRGASVEVQEESQAAVDAWEENASTGDELELVQEETSDPGLEPAFASRTDSPVSQCESEQSVLNRPTDGDGVEKSQETSSHIGTNEDKLYPDGEEMDTWDSVIEKKADVKPDDGKTEDGEKRQHAEPEDDISAKEAEHEQRDAGKNPTEDAHEDPPLSDKEDDDSQNVSVSWRTEVESDNTLADTRPLIQYRSEETPHVEKSELSEGDREKKDGDPGTWSEGRRFGTMEDLCEEAEGDVLEEEYDLGYTHAEDTDDGHNTTTREDEANDHQNQNQNQDENEGNPCAEMGGPTDVDLDEELDTDRLVEEELDKLCTDSYSSHFALWQHRQKEVEGAEPVSSYQHRAPQENLLTPHTQGVAEAAEQRQEEEDGVSMATRADEREEAFNDLRPEVDDFNDPQEDADLSSESQEHPAEEAADPQAVPEWESLNEAGIRDEAAHGQPGELVPESDEGYHHDDKGSDEGVMGPAQVSPHSVPEEDQVFVLEKRGKDEDAHDVLSFSDELWACPVETRASCQSEDVCSQAAEPKNQNHSFAELNGNSLRGESGDGAGPERGEEQQPVHSEESEGESWSSGEEPV